MSVIDVDDSNDDVCDRNCRRCGFGVNLVKNCVGLVGLPPNVSRSGNDLEYFSSDADLLLMQITKERKKMHSFNSNMQCTNNQLCASNGIWIFVLVRCQLLRESKNTFCLI